VGGALSVPWLKTEDLPEFAGLFDQEGGNFLVRFKVNGSLINEVRGNQRPPLLRALRSDGVRRIQAVPFFRSGALFASWANRSAAESNWSK
jgi:hypothetical protein